VAIFIVTSANFAAPRVAAPVVVDERRGDGAPGGLVGSPQDVIVQFVGSGLPAGVGFPLEVGNEIALVGAACPAARGVIGGSVERRVRGHHQREIGVQQGALAGAGRARDECRL